MAWMIIKSAGDSYSFIATEVPGEQGHTYEYATKQAREVTRAMKAYKRGNQLNTLEATEEALGAG